MQFMKYLKDSQLISISDPEHSDVNRNSSNVTLVKAIIAAGLYPNVARIVKKYGGKNKGLLRSILLPDKTKAALHPKSVNEKERNYKHSWFVYWEKIKTKKVCFHN